MYKKRYEWEEKTDKIPKKNFVFLDESGINIDLVIRYGRSIGKTQVVDSPHQKIQPFMMVVPQKYLNHNLFSQIHEGDYVVMDNLRTHHCKEVEEMICAKDAAVLYLPPYSPDLNPIEKRGQR